MKGEFVATVSHELRTPLTSIKGSLALLASDRFGAMPDRAKAMIEIAQGNSERLARIINDILDIEKIKAGHMTFALQKVEVPKLLEDKSLGVAKQQTQAQRTLLRPFTGLLSARTGVQAPVCQHLGMPLAGRALVSPKQRADGRQGATCRLLQCRQP